MAIWGVVRRKGGSWAIRNKNANLDEFDGLRNGEATGEQEKALTEMTRQE